MKGLGHPGGDRSASIALERKKPWGFRQRLSLFIYNWVKVPYYNFLWAYGFVDGGEFRRTHTDHPWGYPKIGRLNRTDMEWGYASALENAQERFVPPSSAEQTPPPLRDDLK